MNETIVAWWLIVFFGSLFALVWQAAKKERKRKKELEEIKKIVRRYKEDKKWTTKS